MFQRLSFRYSTISAAFLAVGLAASTAFSRTVVLDASAVDRMAAIHQAAPRLSWAANNPRPGQFRSGHVHLETENRFLLRFDLSMLPEGQRITRAELSVPVVDFSGNSPRLFLWRVAAEWGAGVCYDFRMLRPERAPWRVPGARGAGSDRALNPSAVVQLVESGEQTVDVTEDVAMWYLGAAPEQGWVLGIEDPGVQVRLWSPLTGNVNNWTLRITYEPE